MTTKYQKLGDRGEIFVCKKVHCPKCKKNQNTLRQLPTNFKCADVICDFCGFLAQVKTFSTKNTDEMQKRILGSAWKPQKERIDAGIYYPFYFVGVSENPRRYSLWYLPIELQTRSMFEVRKPLSDKAKRAGWQGFVINLDKALSLPVRLY